MGGVIAESQRRVGPTEYRTSFERNLLPGFAVWVVEQIDRWEPDYLMPVETRGVHVLDAALAYAREELGAVITTPVLYRSALAYQSEDVLRDSRVLIVEDAVDTGASLNRFWREMASRGIGEIRAIACMGCGEPNPSHPDVRCYLRVDPARYMQYLWQLIELVVARGLPPEVDHSAYELRLPRRLTPAWQELQTLLSGHGELSVDGPVSRGEEIQPMTLHFPRLLGMPQGKADAVDRRPNKVRFFPDPDGERVFVLPISFPVLRIKSDSDETGRISRERATEALRRILGARSQVGDLLIEHARVLDPVTVFRAVSTAREVEMIRGVARVIGGGMPGSILRAHHDVFDRLFGAEMGARLGALVTDQIEEAQHQGAREGQGCQTASRQPPKLRYLDATVAQSTRSVAEHLKGLSSSGSDQALGTQRPSMSLPQLADELAHGDDLLASRSVTFGLAMTTLVPFIESLVTDDGSVCVERQYRVSEPYGGRQAERAHRDLDVVRQEKSEQALAVICNRLREQSKIYNNAPIPQRLLSWVVAVLRALVLQQATVELKVIPGSDEPRTVLLDTVEPIFIDEEPSIYYKIDARSGDVTPTSEFESRYEQQDLDLDLDGSTESIENNVDQLVAFIDDLEEQRLERFLAGWAMCTDRALGLTHVRRSIQEALAELRRPLKLILSGESHPRSEGVLARAGEHVAVASEKLVLLQDDWSAPSKSRWGRRSGRREGRLLASLGVPKEPALVYEFSQALTGVIGSIGGLVEYIDSVSADGWEGDEEQARKAASEVTRWCARVRRALTSLSREDVPEPSMPTAARDAVSLAAAELLDLTEQLDAVAAALSGVFRGLRGAHLGSRRAPSARHLSVLIMDIAGYTAHGEIWDARSHNSWARRGLDLAAQWTRAFGGWERPERKGDEIMIEYDDDGDGPALAAAAVQCYTQALRSTGIDEISWRFHSGVACGQVEDDEGAVVGQCVTRASKIAKEGNGKSEATQVMITPEGVERCSDELCQAPVSVSGEEVVIAEQAGRGQIRIRPRVLDSRQAMRCLTARLSGVAENLATDLRPASAEPTIEIEPVPDKHDDESEAISSA